MLEGIFINILSSLIFELSKAGFKQLLAGTPATKAIALTAKDFPSLHQVKPALKAWCQSDEFIEELERLSGTTEETSVGLIADSFIFTGSFHDNVNILNTPKTAQEVLACFFKHLEAELYKTEHAPLIEATKAKLRMQETRSAFQNAEQQNREQTVEIKTHIDESFKQYLKPVEIESAPEFQEKLHLAEIDFAVRLMREGKTETARARLIELRDKIGDEMDSVNLRFRLTANIGISAFHLEDLASAHTEFERALALKPDHKLILSHYALVLSLQDDSEKAVEYARRSLPAEGEHQSVVAANYLRVMHRANLPDEIKTFIENAPWVEQDANCAASLGIIKFDEKDEAGSEAYFRTAHAGDPQNPQTLWLLAQSIIIPIDRIVLNNPPLSLPEEYQKSLAEAENYLTVAIEIFDKQENKTPLFEALLQRAYLRSLMDKDAESLSDCEWMLRISPGNDEALRQKGHTLLFSGKTDEALQCFNRIEDEKSKDEAILSTAMAYGRIRNHRAVIDLIADKLDTSVQSRQQTLMTDMLLAAYHFEGDAKRANEIVAELDAARSGDPEILVVTARQQFRAGQQNEALERYLKAISLAEPGNQKLRINLEAADAFYESGKWAEAAQIYAENVNQSENNALTRRYLTALYNSGARDKAFELAKNLRGAGGAAIPFVSEIEAGVLLVLEDYENALSLFEQLALIEPEKVNHRFSIIETLQKLERSEEAKEALEKIRFDEIKTDAVALVRAADLRQQLGIGGDLAFAYQARLLEINDKEIHHAYIQLFMNHTERESGDLDVAGIEVDYFVELKNKRGEITTYHLVDREDYDLTKGEIPLTDPRAVKLLRLKTGNKVVFDEGAPNEVSYEISLVQNKYVHAFQESIKKYNEWFGGSGGGFDGLMVMDVADGDVSSLLRLMDSQKERGEMLTGKFREGHFPLARMARLSGKSLFETWFSMIESNGLKIVASSGEFRQFEKEIETVKKNKELVIDLSGLLTLQFLGLLDKLPVAFSRLTMSKSVRGTVLLWESEFDKANSFSTVWEDTGKSFHRQLSAEEIENRREFINQIVLFVERHVEVFSATKVLTISSEKLEEYHEAFGTCVTSMLLADELQLPVYLDDFQLGLIGKSLGWEIDSVSVQAVLLKFKNLGLISQIEYWTALKNLILANYAYISIDADALWWMCRDEGKKASAAMQKILLACLGEWCAEDAAIGVGTAFIRHVCLEAISQTEKVKLINSALDVILRNRNSVAVIDKLKTAVSAALKYSPEMRDLVLELIDAKNTKELQDVSLAPPQID